MSHETFKIKTDRGGVTVTTPIASMQLVEIEERGEVTLYNVINIYNEDIPPYQLKESEFRSLKERLENPRMETDPLWPGELHSGQPTEIDFNHVPMPGCGPLGNPDEPCEFKEGDEVKLLVDLPGTIWRKNNRAVVHAIYTTSHVAIADPKLMPDSILGVSVKDIQLVHPAKIEVPPVKVTLEEHDCVRFLADVDNKPTTGERGVVVHIHNEGEAYEVEYFNEANEETIVTCLPSQIELDTDVQPDLSWVGPELIKTLKDAETGYILKEKR